MKRSITLSALLLLAALSASSQTTINSVANGLFYFPTTWDCTCIPTPFSGQNVNIGHTVTLNNDMAVVGGTLTITSTGQLVEDLQPRSMLLSGMGSVVVQGHMELDQLWVENGTFSNTGSLDVRTMANSSIFTNGGSIANMDSLLNDGNFVNEVPGTLDVATFYNTAIMTNHGSITNVDSLWSVGSFINGNGAMLQADSVAFAGTVVNDGEFLFGALYTEADLTIGASGMIDVLEMLNSGTIHLHGTINIADAITNANTWTGHAGSTLTIAGSFLNSDTWPPQPFGEAEFTLNGEMAIGNSWYNFGLFTGATGLVTVADTSFNHGWMTGTFDFCDLTPMATEAPFVDLDLGTIEAGITYCGIPTAVPEVAALNFSLYPNPASERIVLQLPSDGPHHVRLLDAAGRTVLEHDRASGEVVVLDIRTVLPGLYIVQVDGSRGGRMLMVE